MSGVALRRRAAAFQTRVETKGAADGLAYPWWIAIFSAVAQMGFVLVAAAQRDVLGAPSLAWVALALVLAPHLCECMAPVRLPGWVVAACVLSGVGWLLLGYPIAHGAASPLGAIADAATAVLTIMVAEVVVSDGPRWGLGVLVAAIAVVSVAATATDVVVVQVIAVLFGFDVGYMLRWQMRALGAERAARSGERERATLAERQRIAREIHDLVGHSLSVTLLHVTGARRALQEDRNIEEAVGALSDAERIGREAMADVRRTVGVLATGGEDTRPLPTATDVAALVTDLRAAGVEIDFHTDGDLGAVPAAIGLGVYRIAQESLANVVRHAPGTTAQVRLDVGSGRVRLRVGNPLPSPARAGAEGVGIVGMTARAAQLGGSLRAGPEDRRWLVELTVPIAPHRADPAPGWCHRTGVSGE